MTKKILTIFLLLVTVFCSAYKKPYRYTIQAEKDAYYHNNVGINYLKDRVYYAAMGAGPLFIDEKSLKSLNC